MTAPGPQKIGFWSWNAAAGALFLVERCVFSVGTLPQAPFFVKKRILGPGMLPQAPFLVEKRVFGVATLPQAPFWWKNNVFFVSIMQLLLSIMQLFSDE